MEISIQQVVPQAMLALREKVAAWRRNKQRQRRMPEELWLEAVNLAKEYGVHPVSRNVEVSYTRLKQLVERHRSPQSPKEPRFVEVSARGLKGGAAQVEINRPDGCQMTIRGVDARMLAEMTAAFVGSNK